MSDEADQVSADGTMSKNALKKLLKAEEGNIHLFLFFT